MKRFLVILFMVWPLIMVGQGLCVVSFDINESDLTAMNEATKVVDANGEVCALIKVETSGKGFVFDGGTVGVAKVDEAQTGEVWVYVPANLKRITVKHDSLGVVRDYYFPVRLQPARTYVMKLNSTVGVKPIEGTTLTEDNVPKNIVGSYQVPEGVETIGKHAFRGCKGITSVTIPNSVKCIEEFAFLGCEGLESMTVPRSVRKIGIYAFEYCTGLKSVTFYGNIDSLVSWVFDGCLGLTSVTIPEGITSIGFACFFECTGLESITLPKSLTSMNEYAFAGCEKLKVVYVPKGEKSRFRKILPKALSKMIEEK